MQRRDTPSDAATVVVKLAGQEEQLAGGELRLVGATVPSSVPLVGALVRGTKGEAQTTPSDCVPTALRNQLVGQSVKMPTGERHR